MGCLCSTPPQEKQPLDTLSDAQRKAADEARAKADAERKAEAERKAAEQKEKEKADKIKADAEAEEKRIAAERAEAQREREAKERREQELFREVKWKEEQLARREAELAAREAAAAAEAAALGPKSPKNRGARSPKSPKRALSPKHANGAAARAAAAALDGVPPMPGAGGGADGLDTDHVDGSVGAAAGGARAGAGAGAGAGGVELTDVSLDDDSAEYRRQLTAADKEREKVAEHPDLKSVRLALTDSLAFWATKPGGKSANLLVNAYAQQPGNVGWTLVEGTAWATVGLPVGGEVADLPAVDRAFVCTGRSVRSQRVDLLARGIPAHVLAACPKIEVRCYYTASAPNAVKFKVTCELLDAKGEVIDEFVCKRTCPTGATATRWGEIFHTFKQSAAYDRAPRFVLYKEHGRDKVLRDKATGKVIAVGGVVSPRSSGGDDDNDIGSPKSPRPTAVGGAGGVDANPSASGLDQQSPPPTYQPNSMAAKAPAAAASSGGGGGGGVKQLSSTVRSMKFMQRVDEAAVRKKLEAEQQREVLESQWVVHTGASGAATNLLLDESEGSASASSASAASSSSSSSAAASAAAVAPPPFRSGRRSFGHFNPVVEKIVADAQRDVAAARGEAHAISDEQLANRFAKYVKGTDAAVNAGAAAAAGDDDDGDDDDEDDDALRDPKKLKTAAGAAVSAKAAGASDRPRPLRGRNSVPKRDPATAKPAKRPAAAAAAAAAAPSGGAGSKRDKPAAATAKGFVKPRDPLASA